MKTHSAPTSPFDAALARVAHADRHIERLRVICAEIATADIFGLSHEVLDGGCLHVLRMTINGEVPKTEIALVASDTIHQLRAALDNAAFALAVLTSGTTSPPRHRGIYFPIADTPADFPAPGKSDPLHALRGRPDLVALVESVQPFRRVNPNDLDPLTVLRQLSNVDKHRQLPVVLLRIRGDARVGFDFSAPTTGEQRVRIAGSFGPLEHGSVLYTVVLDVPDPGGRPHPSFAITPALIHEPFPDGRTVSDVDWVLTHLRTGVANAINSLVSAV